MQTNAAAPVKRLTVLLTALCLLAALFTQSFCAAEAASEYDPIVRSALANFIQTWKQELAGVGWETDGHLEIYRTRLVILKPDPVFEEESYLKTYQLLFDDVRYIVEFVFAADYFGTAPYYSYLLPQNAVLVKSDGSCETVSDPLGKYRSRTYSSDFSAFVEQVIDLKDSYNQVLELKLQLAVRPGMESPPPLSGSFQQS